MEMQENIVIVGAGIAGLATALGLHRLGLKSLVLEMADDLRVTGFAFTSWMNAWKALDALGCADLLRHHCPNHQALVVKSAISGNCTSEISLISTKDGRNHESRCIERRVLVETLANELPKGTIRFSSKVVSIQESCTPNYHKILHLADGSVLKTQVLIGCDGTNSIVGRWLGLKTPCSSGRYAIRGFVRHQVEPIVMQFMGHGVKYGFVPINESSLYWFFTFSPSNFSETRFEQNPVKMKEYVLSKLGKGSEKMRELVEKTLVHEIICSPLKLRLPWQVLWGDITKGNVCVAGDAFHPMTPDLGQGACSSLEDGVILARCLGKALLGKIEDRGRHSEKIYYMKAKMGLDEYARERRWRAFRLIATAYAMGFVEQTEWKVMQFLRDGIFASYLNGMLLKMADYDCGQLN